MNTVKGIAIVVLGFAIWIAVEYLIYFLTIFFNGVIR